MPVAGDVGAIGGAVVSQRPGDGSVAAHRRGQVVDLLAGCGRGNRLLTTYEHDQLGIRELASNRSDLVLGLYGRPVGVLESARIFDVYEGPQLPPDQKSIAVEMALRSAGL